jgi:hypothetical protein
VTARCLLRWGPRRKEEVRGCQWWDQPYTSNTQVNKERRIGFWAVKRAYVMGYKLVLYIGSCLSVSFLVSFWTKSLVCKDVVNRDSAIHSTLRRLCTAWKIEEIGSLSAVLTIVSSHPDAHMSPVPSVRTTCHIVQTLDRPSIIRPEDVHFRPDLPLCREVSIQLASVRTSQ